MIERRTPESSQIRVLPWEVTLPPALTALGDALRAAGWEHVGTLRTPGVAPDGDEEDDEEDRAEDVLSPVWCRAPGEVALVPEWDGERLWLTALSLTVDGVVVRTIRPGEGARENGLAQARETFDDHPAPLAAWLAEAVVPTLEESFPDRTTDGLAQVVVPADTSVDALLTAHEAARARLPGPWAPVDDAELVAAIERRCEEISEALSAEGGPRALFGTAVGLGMRLLAAAAAARGLTDGLLSSFALTLLLHLGASDLLAPALTGMPRFLLLPSVLLIAWYWMDVDPAALALRVVVLGPAFYLHHLAEQRLVRAWLGAARRATPIPPPVPAGSMKAAFPFHVRPLHDAAEED